MYAHLSPDTQEGARRAHENKTKISQKPMKV